MGWCFALINNKLGEIYFDKTKVGTIKIHAHCFVSKKEYKTKQEQQWIREDIKNIKVKYSNKQYKLIKLKK